MSFVDSNGNGGGLSAADVAAVTRNNGYYGGNGFGNGFGGDGAWWLLVLLFALGNNGWGNNFGGGNGMVPFMLGSNCNNDFQNAIDQQSTMNAIGNLATAQANGFANAEVSRCNMQTNLLQAMNQNQQQNNNYFNTIAMNQQANTQQIISSQVAGNQRILDKLCQLELDNVKQNYENRIAALQNANAQLQADNVALRGDISQTAQTARILQDNAAQTATLEQYLNPPAIPAYVVPNPNCCNQTSTCCGRRFVA